MMKLIGQIFTHSFGAGKYQGFAHCTWCHQACFVQQLQNSRFLAMGLNDTHLLRHVLIGFQLIPVSDHDPCRLIENGTRQLPDLPGPCGGEEHGVPTSWNMLQDLLDLRFKAHVQHSIRLIQDQKLHFLHANDATRQEVVQAARGAHHNFDSSGNVSQLAHRIFTAVNGLNTRRATKGEALGLLGDLLAKLTCGSQNHAAGSNRSFLHFLWTRLKCCSDDRNQKRCSLTTACLGSHHDVTAFQHRRDAVLLHWRWDVVATPVQVVGQLLGQLVSLTSFLKGLDGDFPASAAFGGHLDIVVLRKIDARDHMVRTEESPFLHLPVSIIHLRSAYVQ
mmetsp:Transcript_41769/g.90506  ORF Transcript_41769/g.90506 Transcript_41769/m.90506 type:complete len:334 (-) Transcript_41769:769-1770(-)